MDRSTNMLFGGLFSLFWVVSWGRQASSAYAGKVNRHKPWMESSYHGVITENTDTVLLDPPLMAVDKDAPVPYAGEICAFKIHGGLEAQFEAVVLNATSGEGLLRARSPMDCEDQREHTLTIQAYDCGTGPNATDWKRSHKTVVHIQVDDVNEFPPVFRRTQYKASVTEGKIYDAILQVEAWDEDCSPQYSQICNYDIVTSGTPFAIDRNGNIRNTERLIYEKQHSYQFLVTAVDCGQKRANESVAVYIDVEPVCTPGWKGWSEHVDYEPGSGSRQLFPSMHLETCGGALSAVSATLQLHATHTGKDCGHSHKSLLKPCGAAAGSTDLLPAPGPSAGWTASLLTDSCRDGELVFRFDGRRAAIVPERAAPHRLSDRFTIATWMRHAPSPSTERPAHNETLLCSSDKTEMNCHHYSLYVHDCQLVFLLRRDSPQSDSDTVTPAEFHWKLHQICDRQWHYYILNVEQATVALQVDGVTFEPYLMVTGDQATHMSQVDSQLTVGACWQGGERDTPRFTQYFRGSLSGLTVGPGGTERQKVISCLQACREALDITSLESLAEDVKFDFNPAQSVLVVDSGDASGVSAVMSRVSYINSLQFPSPGPRTLHISTTLQCFEEASCMSIPDVDVVVRVLPFRSTITRSHRLARPALTPGEPQIAITGSHRLVRPATDLRWAAGVAPFKEVHITSTAVKGDSSPFSAVPRSGVMEVMLNLDYCDVVVMGDELDPDRESLEITHNALLGKHLDATNSTSGISIYGVDSMLHYEQAVRQVRYRNWRPSSLSGRRFRLTCSELNGRYTSNEFNMEVSVLHHTAPVEHVNHMAAQSQYLRPVHHPVVIHTLNSHVSGGAVSPSVTVVIVVCISGLVLMAVMGVYRIHSTQHQDTSTQSTDTSALTITVNPMENTGAPQTVGGAVRGQTHTEGEEEPTGDVWSGESSDSEDEEEEEDEEEQQAREGHVQKMNGTKPPV